jgi:hypothetical protein
MGAESMKTSQDQRKQCGYTVYYVTVYVCTYIYTRMYLCMYVYIYRYTCTMHTYMCTIASGDQLISSNPKRPLLRKSQEKTRDRNPWFPADFPFNPFIERIFGVGVGFALQVLDY